MYRSRVKHTLGFLLIMKLEHVKKRYLYSRFNFSQPNERYKQDLSDSQNPRFLNFSYKGETRDPQRIFKIKSL